MLEVYEDSVSYDKKKTKYYYNYYYVLLSEGTN